MKSSKAEIEQRLADIAKRMKTAKGKELDRLTKEIDIIIGFEEVEPDPERDAEWQKRQSDD
jgi:hypothetical protein